MAEFLEFEIEDLAAGGARVLEEAVFLVRDRVHVGKDGTEGTLTAVGFGVLGTREPAEEVRGTVVERVGDEMMTNADVRAPFLTFPLKGQGCVFKRGSRAIESERHKTQHKKFKYGLPLILLMQIAAAVGIWLENCK